MNGNKVLQYASQQVGITFVYVASLISAKNVEGYDMPPPVYSCDKLGVNRNYAWLVEIFKN